jgi:hypothetical protein
VSTPDLLLPAIETVCRSAIPYTSSFDHALQACVMMNKIDLTEAAESDPLHRSDDRNDVAIEMSPLMCMAR